MQPKVPSRFTFRVFSNSSKGKWLISPVSRSRRASFPMVPMPAQFTSTRSWPCASRALAKPAAIDSSLETSTLQKMPPMSLATLSPRSSLRSNRATLAPLAARARAVASPKPEAPPVMTAEILESIFMLSPDCCVQNGPTERGERVKRATCKAAPQPKLRGRPVLQSYLRNGIRSEPGPSRRIHGHRGRNRYQSGCSRCRTLRWCRSAAEHRRTGSRYRHADGCSR